MQTQMLNRIEVCLKFGRMVRLLRQARGFSQESLAGRADIHRTYIGGIERGERNPTLTMIVRLAQALEVSPDKLLGEVTTDLIEGPNESQ